MNILSLFGGMDTGRVALDQLGIKVDKSYYSEIKPYAIKLTLHHHPDTISLGDINNWKDWDIDWNIDIIFSGSPCQDLSIAGKRKGIEGERSSLFYIFVDILNHVRKFNPDVLFLQENVGSAPKLDIGIMSRALGIYPVLINSNLLTAQNRSRYYWTNIRTKQTMFDTVTDIPQPKDLKIFLKDIIESGEVEKSKANAILESQSRHVVSQESMRKRSEVGGFITVVKENYQLRKLSQTELERLQGFPDNYTEILSYNHAASLLGDGWTLPVIKHILTFL